MNLEVKLKVEKFKSEEENFKKEFVRLEVLEPMVVGKEYPKNKHAKIFENRTEAVEFVIDFLNQNLKTNINGFHPMFKKPKQVENEHFSETVIVYELDLGSKEVTHFDLGYFDFETHKWRVLGNDSIILYCWSEIPNPTKFMQNKEWAVDYHEGFSN